jgi:glycosyltransferase involved in cell wall biosynthesis
VTIAYDVTRLVRRYAVPSPNGIDRIDIAYARHFIAAGRPENTGIYLHALRPAVLHHDTLVSLLDEIAASWRDGPGESAVCYEAVKAYLLGQTQDRPAPIRDRPALFQRLAPLRILRPRALGRFLFAPVPRGAAFVHTTHFPSAHLFRWLAGRGDVKPVFFIHDLLPLHFPEYFAPAHIAEHRHALDIFVRYARGAIVNTRVVAQQLHDLLRRHGRRDLPVLVQPIPPDPIFCAKHGSDPELAAVSYFIVCGTIEPRKNHLMLLHVWRALARRHGTRTPKLLVIGRRGWENENVVDLLDRSRELRAHVIEIAGLPTAGVARLIAGARALLMPSFAEGYGLPIVEARAAGTPVIAADIPVFREIAPEATFRAPLDGSGWLAAIEEHAEETRMRRVSPVGQGSSADAGAIYFAAVERFIRSL